MAGWMRKRYIPLSGIFRETGYVLDTHTAVGTALCRRMKDIDAHTVIASTASPFKFSVKYSVVSRGRGEDEFESIERLSGFPECLFTGDLTDFVKEVRHDRVIGIDNMKDTVTDIINTLEKRRG